MKHTHTPCCTKQDLCCLLHNHYSKLQHLVQHPAAEGLVESPLLDPPTNCKCTGTHEHAAIAAISGCAHQATNHASYQALLPKKTLLWRHPGDQGSKAEASDQQREGGAAPCACIAKSDAILTSHWYQLSDRGSTHAGHLHVHFTLRSGPLLDQQPQTQPA